MINFSRLVALTVSRINKYKIPLPILAHSNCQYSFQVSPFHSEKMPKFHNFVCQVTELLPSHNIDIKECCNMPKEV